MKISLNDLDPSILAKLQLLDELRLNYTKDDGNVLMYNGQSLYTTKFPEYAKIEIPFITTEELVAFRDNKFTNNQIYTSSYVNAFGNSTRNNSAFTSIMKELTGTYISKPTSKVLFFKPYGAYYYIYTANGTVYKINKKQLNEQTVIDILGLIKTHFACQNITSKNITDILPYEDGLLISVAGYGVYYINLQTGIYELKCNYPYVYKLYKLKDNKLLILSSLPTETKSVMIYDIISGKRIEAFNDLSQYNQIPDTAIVYDDSFYILGRYVGTAAPTNMIHYYRLDAANISYENKDSDLNLNLAYDMYKNIKMVKNGAYINIYGVTSNNVIFVYQYDVLNNKSTYTEMSNICPKSVNVHILGEYVLIDNIAYKLDNKDIVDVCKLNIPSHAEILYDNGKIIAVYNTIVMSYELPKYAFYSEEDFVIYDEDYTCNNIKVLVSSTDCKEKLYFYDENNKQIIPDFLGVIEENNEFIAVIKNCNAYKIKLHIAFSKNSNINSIIVKTNNEYYTE